MDLLWLNFRNVLVPLRPLLVCFRNRHQYKVAKEIFFKSNLGFCLELELLNSETEIGTGVA